MKKYIVLSVNDNQDYLYFVPLVLWAWRKFGWEPIVFYYGELNRLHDFVFGVDEIIEYIDEPPVYISSIEGYRSDTITQISRLYASEIESMRGDEYIMTGDIDMIPLSDYWEPQESDITVYGHDLTGFGHYPICYIGMTAAKWHSVMKCSEFPVDEIMGLHHGRHYEYFIKRDLDMLPQAKDPDFYKYWFSDQDLITARLNEYGKEKIKFINRGQGTHGYARGRVDRGNGGWVFNQPELIDAHLIQQVHHRQERVQKVLDLLKHVWPAEDWTWWLKYTDEYRKLTGHTA